MFTFTSTTNNLTLNASDIIWGQILMFCVFILNFAGLLHVLRWDHFYPRFVKMQSQETYRSWHCLDSQNVMLDDLKMLEAMAPHQSQSSWDYQGLGQNLFGASWTFWGVGCILSVVNWTPWKNLHFVAFLSCLTWGEVSHTFVRHLEMA